MITIKIGEITVDITASTSKLRANLAQASSLIRDWSLLSQGLTGGITNAFQQISTVGIRALQIGLGSMAATFALTAKTGADFEDEMVRTFTILKESANVTSAAFVQLTYTARILGRDTLFSAIDAAEGMQILAKAGFDTREIIDSIRPTLDLAIVGNIGLARSADLVIAALKGFNLETAKATKVSDILALASSKANTTVEDLGTALSYVAPIAAGAGISMEETAAAIGILSNAGIRGSRAGTTLRRALSQLLAPTGRAKKIMDELNLSFVDGTGKLKPFTTIIRELNEASITASQAMQMFGLRAGPGMIALMREGSQGLSNFVSALRNSEGVALRMSQAFRTTVKGRVRDLMASVIDLGLAFSEQFRKPLADAIFAIRNFVVSIVNTGNRMGLFKAIVKGVRSTLEPIIEVVGELAKKFKDWIATLTPQDVADFFTNIRGKIEDFIESIREGELGTIIRNTFDMIISLGKGIVAIFGLISKAWGALPQKARELIGPMLIITTGFLTLFGGLTNVVFLVISLKALFGAIGLKISLGATLLAIIKGILVTIMWVVGIIAAGIAGWKLGSFIGELSIVKGYFAGLFILIGAIGPSLKLAAMGLLAFSQPWRLLNKEFRADMAKTVEDIKIKADAIGEIDWFGTKGAKGDVEGAKPGAAKGGMKIGIGGELVDIGSFLGTEFEPLIADIMSVSGKASEDTQSLISVLRKLGVAVEDTTQSNSDNIEVLKSELEVIIGKLEGVTRQVRKPEADRKNKSRIGASLE